MSEETQTQTELLSAYLDSELNSEELNRVNSMLVSSAHWRRELEKLRKIKQMIGTVPPLSAPRDLVANLQALYQVKSASRQRRPSIWAGWSQGWWVWGGSLATAAVMVVVWIATQSSVAQAAIPLDPLLAAHARYQSEFRGLNGVVGAANYSGWLHSYENSK